MRIKCKDGFETESFKMSDIVVQAIARMNPLTDFNDRSSYYTHKEFAELCLQTLCKEVGYLRNLKLKHLKNTKKFIESCKTHYHRRKSKELVLRSFRTIGDGWVFLRYNADTNPNDIKRLDLQAKERVANHIWKYNERVDFDRKQLKINTTLRLPDPNI